MPETCTVVIGAQQHLDALRKRAASNGGGEVLAFSDADPLRALEAINQRHPQAVTLERLFAATPRGAALINRIKADPALSSTEIRIVSHDGGYARVSPRRMPPAGARATAPAVPIDWRGTRRAARFRMKDNTEAQVDEGIAKVVDLSPIGAQIVSKVLLKPLQRLKIVLGDDLGIVRFNGTVAWALFEMPEGVKRYRAGIEFKDAEASEVEAFAHRHKKK